MEIRIEVTPEQAGSRLDVAAAEAAGITRSAAQKQCEEGMVRVNGKTGRKNDRVSPGDVVEITIPEPVEAEAVPQDIPLDILYEDDALLVVNKPKGMVVHPAPGHPDSTLVNALLYHCRGSLSGINGVLRPGIVHRIDRDTSGLLMVAKTDAAHQALAKQIEEHSFLREYEAVVYGSVREDSGTIDAPIGRHPIDRQRQAIVANGRNAVTHFEVAARYEGFTHLRLRLETGRTHQIRVHLAYRGHPVAGDPVYGPKKVIGRLEGQCLHAKKLGFVHPVTGEFMAFDSELPDYFTAFLRTLRPYGA